MKPDTLEAHRQRVMRALLQIESQLDAPLAVPELARRHGFSLYHFQRVFRQIVGESPHRYLQRLRLERAAFRLRRTSEPVTQLALGSGYRAHEAFTRAFRGEFGASPQGYRLEGGDCHGFTASPVRVVTLPEQRIAFVRHVGPYETWGVAYEQLRAWAKRHGVWGRGTVLGVPWDSKQVTAGEHLRYDSCLTIEESLADLGEVGMRRLAGGDYAHVRHVGPYHTLDLTYDFIYAAWIPASGRRGANAPPYEVYLDNPGKTPPESLRTDVYVPLARPARAAGGG